MAGKTRQADDEFLQQLHRGGELLSAGKVIEAKDHLERAYKLQPGNEKGQNLLGLAYFKLGLFDRAAEIYENLVKENPADPTLRVNLGLVYLKTSAVQRAIREFETATDLAPEHKKAQNYLGIALAQAGEYARAREHFLLAGSDQMAEKMARAIAGEELAAPATARAPEPPPPEARAEAQAEEEAAAAPPGPRVAPAEEEEVREEPAGEEEQEEAVVAAAAASEASELPRRVNGVKHAFVPPSVPPMQAPAQLAPEGGPELQSEDWGSHFGLDEAEPPPPAAPGGGGEQEIELSSADISDGGAIAVQRNAGREEAPPDEQLDQAFAEPAGEVEQVEQAEPPAEEPPLAASAEEEEEERAPREELPAVEVDFEEPPPAAPAHRLSDEEEALREGAEDAELPPSQRKAAAVTAAVPAPDQVAPNFAEVRPPGSAGGKPGKGLQVQPPPPQAAPVPPLEPDLPMAELAPRVALFERTTPGPFHINPEAVAIVVQGEMLTRLTGLVAQSGQLEMAPQNRRFRGRTSDQSFGEGEAQLMRVQGKGRLVVQLPRRTFVAIDLGDESGYFLESAVYAFEEPVAFENGRVPSDMAPDLDLVHLRGEGKVLLELPGLLRSLEVSLEEPVTVPLSNLVGWHGNITPRVVSLTRDRAGKTLRAGVELSGEGFALLSVAAVGLS